MPAYSPTVDTAGSGGSESGYTAARTGVAFKKCTVAHGGARHDASPSDRVPLIYCRNVPNENPLPLVNPDNKNHFMSLLNTHLMLSPTSCLTSFSASVSSSSMGLTYNKRDSSKPRPDCRETGHEKMKLVNLLSKIFLRISVSFTAIHLLALG